ncbi:hypothetical protein ABZ438_35570 [Streptomyces sp. NPDC005786]|uniref:hypothetical protein n=1 Tax=Streptomyces sp. NPDC005786 TaxID=3154891 RepID=UPI0033DFAA82
MSTEQHHADAYGQELARISPHQSEATAPRFTVFQALAAIGITNEQAHDIVSKLEVGAVAGASVPHDSEPRLEDGWFAGALDVASYLLRIAADTTAASQRGRAASSAMLLAHLHQPTRPGGDASGGAGPAAVPDAKDVLAAAERIPWAMAVPGMRHWQTAGFPGRRSERGAPEEREEYIERLEAFVEQRPPGGDAAHARAGQQARLARPVRADWAARDPGHRGVDRERPASAARPFDVCGRAEPGRPGRTARAPSAARRRPGHFQ